MFVFVENPVVPSGVVVSLFRVISVTLSVITLYKIFQQIPGIFQENHSM